MSGKREPPHSKEAEQSIIGAILIDSRILDDISDLSVDEFYYSWHREHYAAILELYKKNGKVDLVLLAEHLRDVGKIDNVGGYQYLALMVENCPAVSNVRYYVEQVKRHARARRVIQICNKYSSKLMAGVEDYDHIIDSFSHELDSLDYIKRMPKTIFSYGEEVLELYHKVQNGWTGIPFPWESMTEMTAGIWPGTVIFFVSRPGVGKSNVAVLCGRHAWKEGYKVLIISPEMDSNEIAERFFVVEAGVSYIDVVKGTLGNSQVNLLNDKIEELKDGDKLWILDSKDNLTPSNMEAAIRACRPDLVAIDSVYKLKFKGNKQERVEQVLDWATDVAKRHNLGVVCFGQQNRLAEMAEKHGGGTRLGTIAMSDQIAMDAHTIFALVQTKDMRADKLMKFVPLKIRRGFYTKDEIVVHWDFDKMKLDEVKDDDDYSDDDFDDDIPF